MSKISGKKLDVPCEVVISLANGPEGSYIHITISDDTSRCLIADITMSLEEWAKASQRMIGEGKATIFRDAPYGCISEHKTEFVPASVSYKRKNDKEKILEPFEVDGWVGRKEDLDNMHRYCCDAKGQNGFNVHFHRWVDDEGNPVEI